MRLSRDEGGQKERSSAAHLQRQQPWSIWLRRYQFAVELLLL